MKFTLMLLSSCVVASIAVAEGRSNSRCHDIFPLMKAVLKNEDDGLCARQMIASTYFDVEFGIFHERQLKTMLCRVINNAESVAQLCAGLEKYGTINDILQLAYSVASGYAHLGIGYLRSMASQGDNYQRCTANQQRAPILSVSSSELEKFLDVWDDFALFTIGYKKTNALFSFNSVGYGPHIAKPSLYSTITRAQEGCHVQACIDAAIPIWRGFIADFYPDIQHGLSIAREYLGVNIVEDLTTGVPQLACEIAAMTSIENVKDLLEQRQLLAPLVELGYVALVSLLDREKSHAEYIIQAEDDADNESNGDGDNFHWKPNPEVVQKARIILPLVKAIREAGLDCFEPLYATKRVQRWCPWWVGPDNPQDFNFISKFL